ncbi:N-acetyltransferase [Bacillus sp. HMF5848]|uniref:GNAT family N-acetyltransferase n=1 Tax=Bacillus sp. HMF5848 TaxID=2495421 RepID=UPI000F76C502|nr:GNAT family protein [Bacillus sp. HMF5848]RSK28590.1 N-acetyltransferase [Bacillus sp. HMF5848]
METNRLLLKNYSKDDLANFHRLKSEPIVWRYSDKKAATDMTETKLALEAVLQNYENSKCDFQALFLKQSMTYIGEAGVLAMSVKNKRAVVGYNILPAFWGQGYATEITKALVRQLFEVEGMERIEALVLEGNMASRKVLEKAGLQQEGLLRHFTCIAGEYKNVCYYGMIRSDYTDTLILQQEEAL